jgi:Raf kinase inhibitor-like YbhB/YbcL family protein
MKNLLATLTLSALAAATYAAPNIKIESPDMDAGKKMALAQVGNANGCTGSNISPAVAWKDLPAGTRSVAVTMFDPDARQGTGFWHWIIYNIPPQTTALPANAGDPNSGVTPAQAILGKNDAGTNDYTGACPPVGARDHRYILTVWALGIDALPEEAGLSGTAFKGYLDKYSLGSKNLIVKYGRAK